MDSEGDLCKSKKLRIEEGQQNSRQQMNILEIGGCSWEIGRHTEENGIGFREVQIGFRNLGCDEHLQEGPEWYRPKVITQGQTWCQIKAVGK